MINKNILFFMPSIEGGGVEKNLFIVSNYFSKKFENVTLITSSSKFKSKFNKKIKIISPNNFFWESFGRRIKYLVCLFLLLIQFIKNKEIIVFSFQANIYCIILCKIFNVKIIVRSNTAPIGWSKNIFKRSIFKIFLKLSDKVMVNSLQFKKDLKKEFSVNADCIYNPLNTKEIIKKSKIKSKKIFKNKTLKIINVGRFTEQKDQITLLKALNEIKNQLNFEAFIIGRGVLKQKLKNYIQQNNLSKVIKLKNFSKNPFPLIKQSDIFILSSCYEGLPNVLLESLVLKKFVISSNCKTGPNEILLNGRGGFLFKVGNYKQLSKLIIKYYFNKKDCSKKLKESINQLKRFDYETNLKKYLNLINSIN